MEATLASERERAVTVFQGIQDEAELRRVRATFLGGKGSIKDLMKQIPSVEKERRKEMGRSINALKQWVEQQFDTALAALHHARLEQALGASVDITWPGRTPATGALHPLTQVTQELVDVFSTLGFDVAEGPQVDLYEYNFDKLAFPPDHPATDMQDSFFVRTDAPKTLLRTHTSTIQVREMLSRKPPLAIVSPGAVYRRDDDVTHSPMFMQLEGLWVDKKVSFTHLRGVLDAFAQSFFGPEVGVRLRPSYFPFVEPGAEVDIACIFCKPWERNAKRTAQCRICKGSGWLEILGCGMVHPEVFEHVGYDPEQYSGFAFGLGIDRIAMLRYQITDIRLLYENDVRFLEQF